MELFALQWLHRYILYQEVDVKPIQKNITT